MHHLVRGIDPTELGGAPFALATDQAMNIWATEIDLRINPNGRVYVLPCIAGHVGADMPGYAGQHVDPAVRIDPEVDLRRPDVHGLVGRQREGRAAQLRRVDAPHQVMHDRVAAAGDLRDLAWKSVVLGTRLS